MAGKWKRWAVAGLTAGTVIAGGWMVTRGELVTEVLDGDSFKIANKTTVRLASLDAPETGNCMADEAKTALSKKILGKRVVISHPYNDLYRRTVALVYTNGELINEYMIRQGYAVTTREAGEENKSIKTVLEKVGKFSGRLRKQETRWIYGEKTKEVISRENGCVFRFNIDKTYFSPRLSSERKKIASLIKKGENVLVMFAGVGPYAIVIAKNSKAGKVYSNEINRDANKYAEMNIDLNKLKDKVFLVPGDAKKIPLKMKGTKFDVIVMARPQLKETFLKPAFSLSKKGTRIFYYDFCKEDEVYDVLEKVTSEAIKSKKKIKIIHIEKAGEIGPRRYRIRVDFVVK